ncbi:flavin-containing monooxygenase 5-like [Patiria miniata]|uniref:Flavin-containing monooxygenase n=1 Tax=Patiria miniata TaxID=46514 RepID=A0A914AZH5_PATMI|nr:flavin-containing monooxygenase 5-like [Patiria miniata]XP_038069074.1 flavin-containing monooxygenase 5-like [Patiria miniata]
MSKKVAIIGAGASGITAIKCCLDEGLQVTCFERSDRIGGLWAYREDVDGQGCVFKSTIINTSKEVMCYSDYPIPKENPNYMHNSYIEKYFLSYVDHFDLRRHIQFRTEVEKVTQAADYDTTGRWKITTKNRDSGESTTDHFDAVMICTGHHTTPNIPDFPGLKEFQGKVLHTHDYKTPYDLIDKRVVVIGIGNSGGDAAVELSRISSKVFLSTRSGAWVLNRVADYGNPVDTVILRRFGDLVPFKLQTFLAKRQLQAKFDHAKYGLQPKCDPFHHHPFLSDDLPNRILSGAVVVKPNIARFTETGVKFVDGTFEDNIDCVILATGYSFSFPFVDCPSFHVIKNEVSLYKYVFAPDLKHPSICTIGLVQPVGAINPCSEIQSRWAARVFTGQARLPSRPEMEASIKKAKDDMRKRYVKSQRHTLQVDWIKYMDSVAIEFGVKPDFLKMFLSDPFLAVLCYFGPCSPYQYRLVGPGKWVGAREAIITFWDRVHAPLKTRLPAVQEKTGTPLLLRLGLAFLLLYIVVYMVL